MQITQRQKQILAKLKEGGAPVSATALASELGVSRQIVVGDVALLRAAGYKVTSGSRGYRLPEDQACSAQYRCRPCVAAGDVRRELYAVVQAGGEVRGIAVDSGLYGALWGRLRMVNPCDVDLFLMRASGAGEPRLSERVHTLAVHCDMLETARRIARELGALGCLLDWEVTV